MVEVLLELHAIAAQAIGHNTTTGMSGYSNQSLSCLDFCAVFKIRTFGRPRAETANTKTTTTT